jgi:hypothetical protein
LISSRWRLTLTAELTEQRLAKSALRAQAAVADGHYVDIACASTGWSEGGEVPYVPADSYDFGFELLDCFMSIRIGVFDSAGYATMSAAVNLKGLS